jgi:hypothetical protein
MISPHGLSRHEIVIKKIREKRRIRKPATIGSTKKKEAERRSMSQLQVPKIAD